MDQNSKILANALKQGISIANGCTEPVSIAYAAATCAKVLDREAIKHMDIGLSANVLKNALAVIVPGTGHAGITVAGAVGYLYGDSSKGMDVIPKLDDQQRQQVLDLSQTDKVEFHQAKVPDKLFVHVKVTTITENTAEVFIAASHTNVYRVTHNGQVLVDKDRPGKSSKPEWELSLRSTNFQQVWDYGQNASNDDLALMKRALKYNEALVDAGLHESYGMKVGQAMAKSDDGKDSLDQLVVGRTAAAVDARMGGAPRPASTISGSGNQGIAATIPLAVIADQRGIDQSRLLHALVVSHLTAMYIHSFQPVLSAYCVPHSASMGAAAGICYLLGYSAADAGRAIKTMIGDATGMICDGAGCSCALKVATAVSDALRAVQLAHQGITVPSTNGVVSTDVDATIRNLGQLTQEGIVKADPAILKVMLNK